jgi:hypothetical protein
LWIELETGFDFHAHKRQYGRGDLHFDIQLFPPPAAARNIAGSELTANPVKKSLLLHPKDRPWSSWSHYAKGEMG